jgi:hypothetical protein
MREGIRYEEAAEAVRNWYREHGRLPLWKDWERATQDHPAAKSIHRVWGWHEFLASAVDVADDDVPGLQGAWKGGPGGLVRTDNQMLADLNAYKGRNGRWPGYMEWMGGTDEHASSRTYGRRFGSWLEGLRLAGRTRRSSSRREESLVAGVSPSARR